MPRHSDIRLKMFLCVCDKKNHVVYDLHITIERVFVCDFCDENLCTDASFEILRKDNKDK